MTADNKDYAKCRRAMRYVCNWCGLSYVHKYQAEDCCDWDEIERDVSTKNILKYIEESKSDEEYDRE